MKEEIFPVSCEKYVPQYIKKGMKSCSTPAHYYDRNKADKFDVLFGCTSIGDNPTDEHNKYIVVRYDFSKMSMSKDNSTFIYID